MKSERVVNLAEHRTKVEGQKRARALAVWRRCWAGWSPEQRAAFMREINKVRVTVEEIS